MSLKVDSTTKSQAMEYADNEAEIHGYERGGSAWQNAINEYVKFAIGTMSVGRNPRSFRWKTFVSIYADLNENGFAGKVAKNYRGPSGVKGVGVNDIQNRILASVTNLSKLYENGILGIKTTTTGSEQGQISNDKMSELQLPDKSEFSGNYDEQVNMVVRNWVIRDIVSTIILELLTPFFKMTEADFDAIAEAIKLDQAKLSDISKERMKYIVDIQQILNKKMAQVNVRKLLLG